MISQLFTHSPAHGMFSKHRRWEKQGPKVIPVVAMQTLKNSTASHSWNTCITIKERYYSFSYSLLCMLQRSLTVTQLVSSPFCQWSSHSDFLYLQKALSFFAATTPSIRTFKSVLKCVRYAVSRSASVSLYIQFLYLMYLIQICIFDIS